MSLQDPKKKMSKSDQNVNGCIGILDDADTILKKFKRAITDSDSIVKYSENKDGINNLMTIYSAITGKSYNDIELEFKNKGYGDFKLAVGETVVNHLKPIQEKFKTLLSDRSYLENCYKESAEIALKISRKTLSKVMRKIGFVSQN